MRNEGGGFAANIYRAMPEGSIQVTSHQLLVTSHLAPLIPSHSSLISNFRVQGSGLARGACCPLIVCERGEAGSTGSEGSAGVVQRIKI